MAHSKYKQKILAREAEVRRLANIQSKTAFKPPSEKRERPLAQSVSAEPVLNEGAQLIKSMIAQLATVTADPEGFAAEICNRARHYGLPMDDKTMAIIEERLLLAHAKRVEDYSASLPTSERADILHKALMASIEVLKRNQRLDLAFQRVGVETEAELNDTIKSAMTARRDRIAAERKAAEEKIAEQQRAQLIDTVRRDLWRLSNGVAMHEPAESHMKILKALEALGEDAHLAYPDGVTTATNMQKHLVNAYAAAKAQQAKREEEDRQRAIARGVRSKLLSLDCITGNPDVALAELRADIATKLGGDILKLTGPLDRKMSAREVENAINERYALGVLEQGNARLRQMGRKTSDYRDDVANGFFIPEKDLDLVNGIYSYKSFRMSGQDPYSIDTIKKMSAENGAVIFALVTYGYARQGERHDVMLRETQERMTALGGIDKLDQAAERNRIDDSEWKAIKAWLVSAADPTPPVHYRDGKAADARLLAGSSASPSPAVHG